MNKAIWDPAVADLYLADDNLKPTTYVGSFDSFHDAERWCIGRGIQCEHGGTMRNPPLNHMSDLLGKIRS